MIPDPSATPREDPIASESADIEYRRLRASIRRLPRRERARTLRILAQMLRAIRHGITRNRRPATGPARALRKAR